jgi:hypothetical protein
MVDRAKPQGEKGPISLSNDRVEWHVIKFPSGKKARELMIAEMFARSASKTIMYESQPPYGPFTPPLQNQENDLDVTITTAQGQKLMELVEFAPLQKYGPEFKDAPRQLDQDSKSDCLLELIRNKSLRQGGPNRWLLVYVTEQAFFVDPITIEITRRALAQQPPQFERVYYVSPHDSATGSVFEIFPGTPHDWFSDFSDERLRQNRAIFFHPAEMITVFELSGKMLVPFYGECNFKFRYLTPLSPVKC